MPYAAAAAPTPAACLQLEKREAALAEAAARRKALEAELQQLLEAQASRHDDEAAAEAQQVIGVLKQQLQEAQAAAAKVRTGEPAPGAGCGRCYVSGRLAGRREAAACLRSPSACMARGACWPP